MRGVITRFNDPTGPYLVIEDASHNRTEVLPAQRVAALEGREVQVDGLFGVSPTIGRYVRVRRVSRA